MAETAPNGVKLEVTALIDRDLWADLKKQGYSDDEISKSIEKSITLRDIVSGAVSRPPVFDMMEVNLLKYY